MRIGPIEFGRIPIPFIYNSTEYCPTPERPSYKRFKVPALINVHKGSTYQGVLVGGVYAAVEKTFADCKHESTADLEGVLLSGIAGGLDGTLKGFGLTGLIGIVGELEGVMYSGIFNEAATNGNVAVQLGVMSTKIERYRSKGFTFQFSLVNRIDGEDEEYKENHGVLVQIGLINLYKGRFSPIIRFKGLFNGLRRLFNYSRESSESDPPS